MPGDEKGRGWYCTDDGMGIPHLNTRHILIALGGPLETCVLQVVLRRHDYTRYLLCDLLDFDYHYTLLSGRLVAVPV